MEFPIVSSEEFIAENADNVCVDPIIANKDTLEFIKSSKSIINADSNIEKEINNAIPVPTSSEMKNTMKSILCYLDAHSNGEMNNKREDIKQYAKNVMLWKTMQRKLCKTYVRPVLNCGCEVVTLTSTTSIGKYDVVQNSALRIITGGDLDNRRDKFTHKFWERARSRLQVVERVLMCNKETQDSDFSSFTCGTAHEDGPTSTANDSLCAPLQFYSTVTTVRLT
ncbi:hypothetical protein TNCV_3821261 [Trichonephila clavipes]|nr:hypothetical protein TNCV_3821261 [Trichonephila clavipes]